MRRFYYEYDKEDKTWNVYEVDAALADGQTCDVLAFCCATEEDAVDAIKLLGQIQRDER